MARQWCRRLATAVLFTTIGLLTACATQYGTQGFTGGYAETELEPGIWRVTFSGNGFTSRETVQTYWLYRCAELAADHGYPGFRILNNPYLSRRSDDPDQPPVLLARGGGPVYIPVYMGAPAAKPAIQGDIELLSQPFVPSPPKVFDAVALKDALEPLVRGPKCGDQVCPHVHRYLTPNNPPAN